MSGFDISIVAGANESDCSVSVTGGDSHIITDEERVTFQINDYQLKKAVGVYFGKDPKYAYLHSPTPPIQYDLYQHYDWKETYTNVSCISSEIVEFESQPIALRQETFKNNSSVPGTFNISISDSVTQTSTTSWQTSNKISVSQKMTYKVGFLGTGAGGETSMSYDYSWGEGGSDSISSTVGSSSGVTVVLDPGQSVVATLTASRGKMKIRIKYLSKLTGTTAVDYDPTYKGHHYWDLQLYAVMSASNIPYYLYDEEFIYVDYYSNGTVELTDPVTNEPIMRTTALLDPTVCAGSPASPLNDGSKQD